nr:SPOR domain-containing protein [Porphyrobacter sp. GA68]
MNDLRVALTRLAAEPRNVAALIDAGNAALALDDVDAAIGFFGRAAELDPGNPRVKLGLAGAYVATRRPIEALRLFQEAEQGGADTSQFAAKRGLAFDLVGDNASAQQQYRLALSRKDDPRVREQLAISQAVSGDRNGFEATLRPMLEAQDLSAFRTRAFGLAILKREREAVELAGQVMPPQLAQSFVPYLRQLPQLSAVEQIAAVHLGIFPASGQQRRAATAAPAPASASATRTSTPVAQRLAPAGAPMGGPATLVQATAAPAQSRRAEQVPIPASEPATVRQPVVQPLPPERPRPDLSAVFAGLAPATTATPAPGAVDVVRLEARRDVRPVAVASAPAAIAPAPAAKSSAPAVKPAAPAAKPPARAAKPAQPAHPARIWVQLAAGANRDALSFDWRRLSRQGGKVLSGKEPHVTQWGRTNRLLAGPYATTREADAAVKALQEAGLDSFRYQSPEGQEITPLK